MSFLDGLLEGAKSVAPSLVGAAANFIIPGSGNFVNSIVRKVAGVPDNTPVEEAAEIVKNDPEKYLQYLAMMKQANVRFRELDSKDLETVNTTMRVEAKSEKWPVYSWRPFNGFMFGISMFSIYVILPILNGIRWSTGAGAELITHSLSITIPTVDYTTWCAWAAILGVATWDRGKEKRAASGDRSMGRISSIVNKFIKKG